MKTTFCTCVCLSWLSVMMTTRAAPALHSVTIRPINTTAAPAAFRMGTYVDPTGDSITIDRTSLCVNGERVIPVMGEFHFTRYPAADWRRELLKMKAGGINIVSTYVFWNHHEEREGVFRWEDERNLRRFISICGDVGLPVVLRLGPWSHGECRNGGIPDWLATKGIKLRADNEEYLSEVRHLFAAIYEQIDGLLWKQGGPIIGVQIENEYRGDGKHLMTLKRMAREAGFDVPMYTRTGWPKLGRPVPYGELLPLYGDYADGFWDRSTDEMPGDYGKSYIFRSFRSSTVIATEQLPAQTDEDNPDDVGYPYFTCELGGGMVTSYMRRIAIDPMDVYAMSLVRVGSGSNLPGYYMYHGGTNPDGLLTTLNEVQSSPMTNYNEMPVKSYEFQAPLGEFGQINLHYHLLRRLHLFLNDFGNELAQMPATFPDDTETDFRSDAKLRWAVRSDGRSGFVFINNYHRLRTLPDRENVQFSIRREADTLVFPSAPIDIPSGTAFFMPFGLNMAGADLIYSTATPIMKLADGERETVYVFGKNAGIAPEFVFDASNVRELYSNVPSTTRDGRIYYQNVRTGLDAAIGLKVKGGGRITIVLVDEKTATQCWKGTLAGRERMMISSACVTCDGEKLFLTDNAIATTPISTHKSSFIDVHIFPAPQTMLCSLPMTAIQGETASNVFAGYRIDISSMASAADREQYCHIKMKKPVTGSPREIVTGANGSPVQPSDKDFSDAAVFQITLPDGLTADQDIFLTIPYFGDAARLYADDQFLTDNFYNGRPFTIGLRRYAPAIYGRDLLLKILPYRNDLKAYIPATTDPVVQACAKNFSVSVANARIWEMHTVEITAIDE